MTKVYDDVDPSYATLCSDITLYSDQRGFFKGLAEDVLDMAAGNGWLQTFSTAEKDAGKIAAVMANTELIEGLNEVLSRIEPLYRKKDAKVSREKRLAAEKSLRDGNTLQAFALVSQAVLKAPMKDDLELIDGGVSLALALWLRSEVLMKMGKPLAAIEDLKHALKERLPVKMRADYYWRLGHCYKEAGEPSKAKVSYELAWVLLANKEIEKQKLLKDITSLADVNTVLQPTQDKTQRSGATLTGGAKENMPALSKLVKISEDGNKGRFAVASSEIKTGNVLLSEDPYAACLLPDLYGSHCLHCFKRLANCTEEAPVWCHSCSGVAFCSTNCRDIAVNNYHKYECQFLDIFIGSGMSILSHVALRMVTQAGLETSLSIHAKYISNVIQTIECSAVNEIEGSAKKSRIKNRKTRLDRRQKALKVTDKIEKDEKKPENKTDDKITIKENLELKAAQIYSLCTHSELRKPQDYLKRIVMAMFLVECLKKAGFFGDCEKEQLKQNMQSICELLLKNLQLLQFNAHEVYETLHGKHLFSGSKVVYIGVGIYPTGALFNHECYPAVARYFEGRNIVLRAVRPLAPGDVVSENYGPHFLVRGLKDRQRSLTCRYWFQCECNACKEDWPMLKQMDSDSAIGFKCVNEACGSRIKANPQWPNRCPKCSTNIDKKLMSLNLEAVKQCVKQYQEGARQMDEEDAEEAILFMAPSIDTFHDVARCPHKETHLAQESLRTCFASLGNMHKVEQLENN